MPSQAVKQSGVQADLQHHVGITDMLRSPLISADRADEAKQLSAGGDQSRPEPLSLMLTSNTKRQQ